MSDSLWPQGLYRILQARILEWVSFPFSRGSSQPRDQTQVSGIASGFFSSWATREAQDYWSGYPILSPRELPDPWIKPGFPALQEDSLPAELSGKSLSILIKNQLTINVWDYFCTLSSVLFICISILMPVPCCFDYCSFVVTYQLRSTKSPTLVFFLDCFDCSGPLEILNEF